MHRILVPVDGSASSAAAIEHAIGMYRARSDVEVHLVNVQPRLPRHAARFLAKHEIEAERQRRGESALARARLTLDKAGIKARSHVLAGRVPDEVAAFARAHGVARIVVGATRKGALARLLGGSVTNRLVELTTVPVEVIAGPPASPLERYALPAGLGLGLSLLLLGE